MTEIYPPFWHENQQGLREALHRNGDTHSAADVLQVLRHDCNAFWIGTPTTFFFAEVLDYPRKRIINCALSAGRLAEVQEMEARFCAFGRQLGCTESQIYGRAGWERVLPGYHRAGVILRKPLTTEEPGHG